MIQAVRGRCAGTAETGVDRAAVLTESLNSLSAEPLGGFRGASVSPVIYVGAAPVKREKIDQISAIQCREVREKIH
jgi:hypothetical protein